VADCLSDTIGEGERNARRKLGTGQHEATWSPTRDRGQAP
jgi:hypothetical protein